MNRHPLSPDKIIVEHDPDGVLRTYAKFDRWTIETHTFDTGIHCSCDADMSAAQTYRAQWLRSGHEPDPLGCYGGAEHE